MFKPVYPIRTERLMIRPFTLADFEDTYAYHSSSVVCRYMYWSVRDEKKVREELTKRLDTVSLSDEGDHLCLAVEHPELKRVMGEVFLFWRSKDHQQAEVGYAFNPAYAGEGYATEATRVMVDFAFGVMGVRRVFARCDARNVASYRLMERLGMRREAHFRQNEFVKGEWCDELVYAMLKEEWDAVTA